MSAQVPTKPLDPTFETSDSISQRVFYNATRDANSEKFDDARSLGWQARYIGAITELLVKKGIVDEKELGTILESLRRAV